MRYSRTPGGINPIPSKRSVIASSDTLGLEQNGLAKAFLIVDKNANKSQKAALVKLAKEQGGELTKNVVGVESAKIELTTCECENKVTAWDF